MSIEYHIDKDLGVVFARVVDDLNFDMIMRYYRDLFSDPDFEAKLHRIFDYGQASRIDLTAEDMTNLASHSAPADDSHGKTAIITGGDQGRSAFAKLYKTLAEFHRLRKHGTFSTTEEALAWFRDAD